MNDEDILSLKALDINLIKLGVFVYIQQTLSQPLRKQPFAKVHN